MFWQTKDLEQTVSKITEEITTLFGEETVSVILYGSAVSGDYIGGTSDINVMVVVTEACIDRLDEAFGFVARWSKHHVATPLFLTESYVNTSLDVFPLEYLNFQQNYRVLYGKDILRDITFNPVFVRLQCEREVKGKLLLLREAFLETGGKGRPLRKVLSESLSSFLAVFVGLLFLKGLDIPRQKRDLITAVCGAFNLDGGVFSSVMDLRERKGRLSDRFIRHIFKAYLIEIRKLWECIDRLENEMV